MTLNEGNINLKDAIAKVKEVGLNVYTPKSTDSGFVKVYLEPLVSLMPKISGNALKVLMALSYGLQWNEVEVVLTRDQLAKITGLNKETVRVALKELEEKMVVKRLGPNVRRSYIVSNHYVRLGKNK